MDTAISCLAISPDTKKKKKRKKKKMFIDKSEKLFLSIKVCKSLLYTSGAQDVCDKAIVTIFIQR